MIYKILLMFLLGFSSLIRAVDIGSCIQDPNGILLQKKWKEYHDLIYKKTKINTHRIVDDLRMNLETYRLIKAISESEKLISLVDQIEKKFLKKAFVDRAFNDMISSDIFIDKAKNGSLDFEIDNSNLSFKNNVEFRNLLTEIKSELKKSEVQESLIIFKKYDIGILENEYRKSAKIALKLIRSRNGSIENVRKWEKDLPFLRNIPLPHAKYGPFIRVYRKLIEDSIRDFILETTVTEAFTKKFFPKIKKVEIEKINAATAPVELNTFDDHLLKANSPKDNSLAVDGVLRTLWGEAASCEMKGLEQFLAIGKIIADRSIAVCKSIKELEQVKSETEIVRKKNWSTFLENWIGIKRPAPGMAIRPSLKSKGLSDFGRKEKMDLHCAAQVISKKDQFSVWNSYTLKKYNSGQYHKNIPNVEYAIKGPQSENDDQALARILCPQFITNEQKLIWEKAIAISKEIVSSPKAFSDKLKWTGDKTIYFYTHAAELNFAKEVKKVDLVYMGNKIKIKGKSKNPCDHFRLFTPKQSDIY